MLFFKPNIDMHTLKTYRSSGRQHRTTGRCGTAHPRPLPRPQLWRLVYRVIWKWNKNIFFKECHENYILKYVLLNSRYAETGEVPVYGTHSILPKEHGAKFFALPVVRHLNNQVGAIANWDSSIHDSVALNTVSSGMLQLVNIFTSLVKKRTDRSGSDLVYLTTFGMTCWTFHTSNSIYRNIFKNKLHRPGIEPGPPAWQASILPLNQRCLVCEV